MEEKKKMKSVSLNDQPQERKKATYEELNNYCMQLYEQNRQLASKLQERDMVTLFKRLDYLFLVIQNRDCSSFSSLFIDACAKEIEAALSVPEENTSNEKNTTEGNKEE